MASSTQMKTGQRILNEIKKSKVINKWELINRTSISIWTYDKLKPWLEHDFADFIQYDPKHKQWRWLQE